MQQQDEVKENLWSSLLDSVSSGRRLLDKQLLVAGGSPELQKDFLETLESDEPKRSQDARRKQPPVANEFALGYTYQDVLDADHEDILARLSIYTLQEPLAAFVPLVKRLLTPQTIPSALAVILLDWAEPWKWIRQLRDWILFLQHIISTLDEASLEAVQKNLSTPGSQAPPVNTDSGDGSKATETSVPVSRGPGEGDEALGLPICVVCHNVSKIEALEKDYSWREEEFDYLLQFLRTILLKYGASLIYTSSTSPNSLPLLVQSSLEIHSSLKRQTLKHNVVDREAILIPPNWDSWGKIRVIREGFDVEGMSEAWSEAIQADAAARRAERAKTNENGADGGASAETEPQTLAKDSDWTKVMQAFGEAIHDPGINGPAGGGGSGAGDSPNGVQVQVSNMQEFLGKQAEQIEKLRQEDEQAQGGAAGAGTGSRAGGRTGDEGESRVNEHIGPVKFNMGGIQVDAEDMLKSLRQNNQERNDDALAGAEPAAPSSSTTPVPAGAGAGGAEGKQQNEALASFFAGLIKKGGTSSPKPQSKT